MTPQQPPKLPPGWDTDALWRRFQASHGASESRPDIEAKWPAKHFAPHGWHHTSWAVAAMLVIGIAIGALLRGALGHTGQPFREFATGPRHRATVVLHDGTRIMLAPATRLRVPQDFDHGGTRSVTLDGEAYFDVVHDASHPFAVNANGTVVRDIGTAFDIAAYSGDALVQVAVAQGEVCVAKHGERCAQSLRAGDVAHVSAVGIQVQHGFDIAMLTAWRQGRLVFTDTPLKEAVRTLERNFDVHVRIADTTLASARVTGSFAEDRMDEVLTAITTVIGARYEVLGHAVVISRRAASSTTSPSRPSAPLVTARAVAHSTSE